MKTCLLVTIVSVSFVSHLLAAEPKQLTNTRPGHEFLRRFVGEWECMTETSYGPGKSLTTKGTLTAHMIGKFWVVIDRKADIRGKAYHGRATYGFHSRKKKYIGTWTDSISPILWQYEGEAEGNKLVVNSEGPHPALRGKFKYRNTWEFTTKDLLVLTSVMEGPDGKTTTIMKSTCRRKTPKE